MVTEEVMVNKVDMVTEEVTKVNHMETKMVGIDLTIIKEINPKVHQEVVITMIELYLWEILVLTHKKEILMKFSPEKD